MKSPTELGSKLAKQWQQSRIRVERLLNPGACPQSVSIGKPAARIFADNPQIVRQHVEKWRRVNVGKVQWEPVSYRAGSAPVSIFMHCL
ncbi:DUF3322 domain-containing protein [Pseudomonas putida]|uniref:DUF3322 domain-containing protein n=1 Tax=Pseudomonas putida TaxID=303 RepID=UPI0022A85299|nr:DUF3322 domain-containing protein [Pseudomonas putida]